MIVSNISHPQSLIIAAKKFLSYIRFMFDIGILNYPLQIDLVICQFVCHFKSSGIKNIEAMVIHPTKNQDPAFFALAFSYPFLNPVS